MFVHVTSLLSSFHFPCVYTELDNVFFFFPLLCTLNKQLYIYICMYMCSAGALSFPQFIPSKYTLMKQNFLPSGYLCHFPCSICLDVSNTFNADWQF